MQTLTIDTFGQPVSIVSAPNTYPLAAALIPMSYREMPSDLHKPVRTNTSQNVKFYLHTMGFEASPGCMFYKYMYQKELRCIPFDGKTLEGGCNKAPCDTTHVSKKKIFPQVHACMHCSYSLVDEEASREVVNMGEQFEQL